ncbi:MAG: sugar nucleotide-binding protein, partial [Verrucomicrobia bacterium]|nr:sugar nucleotide-binding protein [Verrucomicrobiota bacterium]
ASGYVGQAFSQELRRRRLAFIPLTRKAIDYTNLELLFDYVRKVKPEFIINAAGYPANPNVDACEQAREETLFANTLLPQTIARVCLMTNTPWGHVSSGSIYQGAKVVESEGTRIERDMNRPEFRRLLAEHPERICGFTEWNEPNFSFRHPPCNFYCGTKALAEEMIRGVGRSYIWRPKMLFDERREPRNFLWKIQNYAKVYRCVNSVTHLGDFVKACLNLWEQQAPFGIYNVVNPGPVTSRQIVAMIQRILKPDRPFEFWKNDEEFYQAQARAPRSNCILDASKLLAAGVPMRPATDALADALQKWQTPPPMANGGVWTRLVPVKA